MPDLKSEKIQFTYWLWCLIILGFAVRMYMVYTDPFLHIWDERFHALVARNMMDNPFKPTLRINPLFKPDPNNWTQESLWLHKQPLFMWQMALSMKLFGTNVFAMRYPSVIMGTLMIPMVFKIVEHLSNDKMVALIAASLFCFSNFHLELVSGIRSMDHNDLTTEFYILASVWAWVKYEKQGKWQWVVLMGLFSGAAILTKWLIGLFIYLIWGIRILLQMKDRLNFKEIIRFVISLTVCCIIFVPWQIFIMRNYPLEAAIEYKFNSRHLNEAIEGHEGTIFFYIARFPQMFGEGMFMLIFPGLYFWYKSANKPNKNAVSVLISCALVFLFFSIIVKSKLISHMFFIAPFLMMLLAYSVQFILTKLKKTVFISVFLIILFVLNTKPEKIIIEQSAKNVERNVNIYNAIVYQKFSQEAPTAKYVVNVPDCISFMFFNKGVTAYESFSEEQLGDLKRRKIMLYAYDHVQDRPLPEYIKSYPYLRLIHNQIKQ